MRIAIVCSYFPWPPSVGGVETIVRNVSEELAKRGHEVHVITTPFDVTTMKKVSEYGVEERNGVIVHKLKPGKLRLGYARFLEGLKDSIYKVKPEIVHSHNLHPHLFQLARWKSELKYKLVVELHHPAIELDFFIQKMLMPFAVTMLKKYSKAIDVFIAHTILEKKWLNAKGIHEDKIKIVRFPAIPSSLIDRYNTPSESLNDVIYVGRVVYRKGLHVLIKALSEVKRVCGEVRSTIVGPSDPRYLSKLIALVKQLRLENSITFKGVVQEEEKYRIIKNHKVLVLPSIRDYTPSVLIESQALGVPVVATNVGAIPEMVIHGETGLLVRPNDEYELAKGLILLLKDETLRRELSIKAKAFAKNFTIETVIGELEKIYRFIA